MARIELPKATQEALVRALATYLKTELDVDVSGFDAQFLLDFMAERMGPHWYNQGLEDAQVVIRRKSEDIAEAVAALEKPARP